MINNSNKKMEKALISYIIPVYNEVEMLSYTINTLIKCIDTLEDNYKTEILFIDDGSSDQSWQIINKAASAERRIKGIKLSRNFGHQYALTCGYKFARGDAIICLDADLQDPPEMSFDMIKEWEAGADIVFAIRKERKGETWFKLLTANGFYWLLGKMCNSNVPKNAGDFRLMSRRAVDIINKMPERHRYLRGLVGWIGFSQACIYYERDSRKCGQTKYPLRKMMGLAVDAFLSMSFTPLRLAFVISVLFAVPFILYVIFTIVSWLFFDTTVAWGWSSLIGTIVAFGCATLMMIGITGEYIGRIYEEVKERPLFIVQDTTDNGNIK